MSYDPSWSEGLEEFFRWLEAGNASPSPHAGEPPRIEMSCQAPGLAFISNRKEPFMTVLSDETKSALDDIDALKAAEHEGGGRIPGGLLIAVEGGEGAGKSTVARDLVYWLTRLGLSAVLTCEPGDTDLGRQLRWLLLHKGETARIGHRAETLLFAADRAQHVEEVIRPALEAGKIVVTDRYSGSTIAYQGGGRELNVHEVNGVSHWASDCTEPSLTILLDVDRRTGALRSGVSPDRIESEDAAFHARVREMFLRLARDNAAVTAVIDARLPGLSVSFMARHAVLRLLESLEWGGQDAPENAVLSLYRAE